MTQTPLLVPKSPDCCLVYSGLTWQQFKLIQAGFSDSPGIRLFYGAANTFRNSLKSRTS